MDKVYVNVSRQLDQPKKEVESITITQIDKYNNYLVDSPNDELNSGDIIETIKFLSDKLKSLGHDGSLKIYLTRYIYEETTVEALDSLFP